MRTTIIFILLPLFAFTQNPSSLHYGIMPTVNSKITYTGVVQADSIAASELYRRAKKFVAMNYKSAKDVIQYDDPQKGELICKGSVKQSWQSSYSDIQDTYVTHTFSIECRDGRYKYSITDLRITYAYFSPAANSIQDVDMELEQWNVARPKNLVKYLEPLDIEFKSLISAMESSLSKDIPDSKEDW